ncbi:hypothetical protein [Salinicola halophyticus]|uniref:hypothetical protein n=1 Tax=Salinicola halophyticus TaxID=1808881 RepID=UPI000DA13AE4|nr:hypothetical protein [Salinicola halophyticus]
MSDGGYQVVERKYFAWLGLSWFLFAISAAAAAIVIAKFGIYEVDLPYAAPGQHYDIPVIVAAVSQALAMFLVAGVFTILHGIHESVVEIHKLATTP